QAIQEKMRMMRTMSKALAAALLSIGLSAGVAEAARCGNDGSGFNAWKTEFRAQAQSRGAGQRALQALDGTRYNTATIKADRGQKSFRLTLEQFMERRGAATIVRKGRQMKQGNAQLLNQIERQYGVPPGVILAIWGMETG